MRLLLLGDMAATGFGTVTMDLGRALIDAGADVRFLSFNETGEPLPEPFASRTPLLGTPRGWMESWRVRDQITAAFSGALFGDWAPDAALLLGDVGSILESRILELIPEDYPAFHYAPVEGTGLPPSWAAVWSRLTPIAMSEHGATEIERLMKVRPPVVYHGIDTDAFYPVSPTHPIIWSGSSGKLVLRSKKDCKRAFGFAADQLVILRTDANVVRKGYFDLLFSLAPVLARHPDTVFAIHARIRDFGGDLDDMRSHFAPSIRARMGPLGLHEKLAYVPREVIATLYNAADIYVSNSCEGFGLTIAEAMACGVPVVGLDWSAVPEVVGSAGLLVEPGRLVPNIYAHWWALADIAKFGDAVESLVSNRAKRKQLGSLGPLRVQTYFQWPEKARQFIEAIEAHIPEAVAA